MATPFLDGQRRRLAAVVVCAGLAAGTLALAARPGAAPGFVQPPIVADRVGRAQIFDYRLKDKSVLTGRRDILWGAFVGGSAIPGVYSINYTTVDRDLDKTHTLAWYQANHPDWVVYGCDQSPSREYTGEYVSVDVTNPEVRAALFNQGVTERLAKRPYDAIGVDNLDNVNSALECGVRTPGGFRQLYSGKRDDPGFATRMAGWMAWLANRVHARGLALAGNLAYEGGNDAGGDREDYLKIERNLDIVLDETGFERNCRPLQTDAKWRDRIDLFRQVALTKALIEIEYVCPTLAEITPATLDWSLANYLLIKADRTYLALLPMEKAGGALYDFPELYLKIGRPAGPMAERGGVYFRQFDRALALVNPSSTASARFALDGAGWRDRVTGGALTGVVSLPPATGRVFVRAGV